MDYSDLWSKSYPAKVYLLFSLGFLLQLNRMYITLSINNNSDPQHLPYSPPFSWMKSATSKSSATPMATWLTAAVKLILKEMSASCHLKLTIQTSFSHTKDQLTMWYARSTRTTGCHSWDSKKNGHFVLIKCLVVQKRDPRATQSVWTGWTFEKVASIQPHILESQNALGLEGTFKAI